MRLWLSGPRILGGLVRSGISPGREDLHPRLPSWRRFELRAQLKAGAIARGEAMTRAEADYVINKALATGVLDSSGDLTFHTKGSREDITQGILERCAAWHRSMTRAEAERLTDQAIRRRFLWAAIIMAAISLAALVWAVAANAGEDLAANGTHGSHSDRYSHRHGGDHHHWLRTGAKCFNEWGEQGTLGRHCYVERPCRTWRSPKCRNVGAAQGAAKNNYQRR